MPYRWTEPEVAVEHKGTTVYHTYKDEYASTYWYTLDEVDDDWEGGSALDVRDLKAYDPGLTHEQVLRAAIETGELEELAYGTTN